METGILNYYADFLKWRILYLLLFKQNAKVMKIVRHISAKKIEGNDKKWVYSKDYRVFIRIGGRVIEFDLKPISKI